MSNVLPFALKADEEIVDEPHYAAYTACLACGFVMTSIWPTTTHVHDLHCGECGKQGLHVVWNRHQLSGYLGDGNDE